jgi:hypothetical protein
VNCPDGGSVCPDGEAISSGLSCFRSNVHFSAIFYVARYVRTSLVIRPGSQLDYVDFKFISFTTSQ